MNKIGLQIGQNTGLNLNKLLVAKKPDFEESKVIKKIKSGSLVVNKGSNNVAADPLPAPEVLIEESEKAVSEDRGGKAEVSKSSNQDN